MSEVRAAGRRTRSPEAIAISPELIRQFQKAHGLTNARLAAVLGVTERTVDRFRRVGAPLSVRLALLGYAGFFASCGAKVRNEWVVTLSDMQVNVFA